jgi:hypothetical protein
MGWLNGGLVGFLSHPVFRRNQSVSGCWQLRQDLRARAPAGPKKNRAPRAGLRMHYPRPPIIGPFETTANVTSAFDVFRILV